MAHRLYRICLATELTKAEGHGFMCGKPGKDNEYALIKNDSDDRKMYDFAKIEKTDLFKDWPDFPFGSKALVDKLTQDPRWSVIRDMANCDRRWATKPQKRSR